jgi:hypothetical protein
LSDKTVLRRTFVNEKEEAREEWRELQNYKMLAIFYSRHVYKDHEIYENGMAWLCSTHGREHGFRVSISIKGEDRRQL